MIITSFVAAFNGYQQSMNAANELRDTQLLEYNQLLSILLDDEYSLPPDLFPERFLFQVFDGKTLLFSSDNSKTAVVDNVLLGFHSVSYEGYRWRILVTDDHAGIIVSGLRADRFSFLVENIILQAIKPLLLIIPLLGLVIWAIVFIGLKPLKKLAQELGVRDDTDLSKISLAGYPKELTQLVASSNQLFHRLEGAFTRERRFSADAAHELRTPLTTLKLAVHNLTENPLDAQAIHAVNVNVERMHKSVEQILNISKLGVEQYQQPQPIDLYALLQNLIAAYYPKIDVKQQTIALDGAPSVVVGFPFSLELMLGNLLDNACKYTPLNGSIHLAVETSSESVVVIIEDSGNGIDPSLYHRVFDRFYRVGGDRHASGEPGSGLGMALVAEVIEAHRGRITLGQSSLGGLSVRIDLPAQFGKDSSL